MSKLKCEICDRPLCDGTNEGISNTLRRRGEDKELIVCKACAFHYYDTQANIK